MLLQILLNDDNPYDAFGPRTDCRRSDACHPGEIDCLSPGAPCRAQPAGVWPHWHNSGGVENQMDIIDDQINSVFRTTLAMTVACARRHDRKLDPILTRDNYGLAGIFLSIEPRYGAIKQKYSNNLTNLLPIGAHAQARHDAAEDHMKQLTAAQQLLAANQKRTPASG